MSAAPIHPSDTSFINGKYDLKNRTLPCGIGGEGSGVVISSGGGLYARYLVGKRVACVADPRSTGGTWAEYLCTKAEMCFPVSDDVTDVEAATLFGNPLTIMMFMDKIRAGGHQGVVQTGALSAVGKMLMQECLQAEIPLINVVRKPQQVQQVLDEGGVYALNSEDPEFEVQLKALCQRLNVTVAFDCVAGEVTGKIFTSLNGPGTVYVYGFLSGKPIQGLDLSSFIFSKKRLEGLHLTKWLKEKGTYGVYRSLTYVMKAVKTTLRTHVSGYFSLQDVFEAVKSYKAQMSAGKVIIRMS
jgi:NADPH:quinone reductase-like Zn-dependent oxidoreductase